MTGTKRIWLYNPAKHERGSVEHRVDYDIDFDKLLARLASKAQRNKSRRTQALWGLVKIKVQEIAK